MHVHNYFIETLVLCFSCGNDGPGPGSGCSNNDLLNGTSTCNMNNPTKIVIGKQVHWSDQIGEQCDESGPIQYDLEPIKDIIRLQFVVPPPSCENNENRDSRKPGKKKGPQKKGPPYTFDVEEIEYLPITRWTSKDTTDLSEEADFINWLQKYPEGEVFIVIKSEETDSQWISDVGEMIEEASQDGYPAYIITIDWSQYWTEKPELDYDFVKVVDYIVKVITRFEIPVEKLTIIAFGTSAHVAGAVGHYFYQDYNRLLFKIIALNPTAQFYIEDNQYFHTLDDTDAKMVLVIHTESGIGYCCNTGTIDVYVNNHTLGQPWCDNQDRMCSYLSAVDIFVDSFKLRPVNVVKEGTNESLAGFPLDVSTNESGVYYLYTDSGRSPIHRPANVKDVIITTPEGNTTVINILNRRGRAVEQIEEWFSDHPNGRLIIIITAQESSNPSWAQDLQNIFMIDNTPEDTPLYVMIVDWSQHAFGDGLDNTEEVAKTIALMLKTLMLSEVTTIIAFGPSCHVAGYVGRITISQYNTEIYQIIALSPQASAVTPTDAKIVMVIHTYSSPESNTCCNMGTIDIIVNSPESGQPWCQGDVQCSKDSSIQIFTDAYIYRPILVEDKETGQNLTGFPLNVDSSKTGVYYIESNENGTEEEEVEEGEEIEVIPITSWTSNSTIELTEKTDFIEWLEKYPEGQVFIIIKSKENGPKWLSNLREIIEEANQDEYPAFIIAIDWSEYWRDQPGLRDHFANKVAKNIVAIITNFEIPVERLTIIAFGTSAHVAGAVGHRFYQENNRLLFKIIALNPTAQFYIKDNQYFHTLDDTDAEMVMVIHTESGIGYCCNTGTIDVYVNNPTVGQPWCEARDRMCSYLSAEDVLVTSFKQRPVVVFKEETNENLDGFPFDVSTNERGVFYLNTEDGQLPDHHPDNVEDLFIITSEGNTTITDMVNRQGQVVELIEEWFSEHPNGRLLIIITAQESSNPSWAQDLQNMFMIDNKPEDTPLYVMIVDWSQHPFGANLDNAEEVAKTIALMLKSLMLSEVTTIIAFGRSCHVAGYVGRIVVSQHNTELYEIIALSPQVSAVTPTDAKIVMVIHTYSSPESKTCCNMGTIDIVINSPESGQPWCQEDVQCSIESSIKIFMDAYLYRPILVKKEETGENLPGFPLNVDVTETGVFYIETARNGTVIIYNKGEGGEEEEEVDVIPISSWTSNSTIDLSDKTEFIEWVQKYPEGQVFLIIKSEENGPRWVSDIGEIIEEANQDGYPAFIIIIDWSEYSRDEPGLLNYFANKVAENVIAMITRFEIPVERLTIIAFGTSAHVAGAIGHRFNQENNRLLFKIIALNPTARFYIKGNQYFHTLDDTDAEMVMVIHTESGIGYCCNTGTIDVYVNNPTVGQPWCDARDRMCSYLSAEDVLVTSFKQRPVIVFKEETNENLDGFPFDVSTNERGVFYLNTEDGKLPDHHPANIEDIFIITSEGNATITDMVNRQGRVVELIEEWFSEHPNGRLIIIITAQESSNPSWAQDLQNMFMIDNKPEDTPLYVMIVDWSHHPFGATVDNAEEVAKTIALMLKSLMLSEVTTIIAFGSSCHVAGYVGRITMSQYNTEIYEIIALNPQASAVYPTDAKIVMVIHTYSSPESKNCCNMGTIDIVINSPESGQPWCQGDVQCSIESSIKIFMDAFLYRPILVEKEETGENLNGFPLNVDETETGVFHIETARNGTVIIYNKGDEEDEQEEVEVIPISSWTSNSTIELTDKTDFIEWLEKYPEGQVFIIIKSEENSPEWVSDLREIIEEANQDGYPAYIIVIDWSAYWRDEPGLLNYFANKVAENVIAMIMRFEIPVERLTIIAFGTSAHVAGAIGHRFNQENNRLLFKIIALNPTARFYIKGNQYFHTLDDTDAEMVMVIHTESGIGYCCNTGTIDVYVNNPTVGQPWCDARDRMCSYLSAEYVLVTSFKQRPVIVLKEETNENLDGFPFDVSTNERGVFYLNTDDGKLPDHNPANVEDIFIITSEGNATITDMVNGQGRVVELIEEWFSEHPNGRLIIIITAQESSNPSWAQDIQNMFMIDNKSEDTPLYVMIVDWSQHPFGANLDNAEEVAKTIALMLKSLMLSEFTTIIAFDSSCHVAGYVGRITMSQYNSEIYEIIALSPQASAVTPTDAKIVMVIHTYSSPESKTCCNMGTIDIVINSPESGQPWCQGDVQCSIESSIKIFMDAFLYRPILVEKEETGENLHGFPVNVDETETGVFHIETARNGTVIIYNKGDEEDEQAEVEVIPISSWTSNSTIELTEKTDFIEWLEKYPEGQVFIIIKSEENGPKWVSGLREIIEEANQDGYPAFILIIDWSEYWRDEPGLLNYFANKVAENVIAMITRFEIPVERLTIIAFGTSAHVAGAIGHRFNQENNRLLFKIIALNPTARFYIKGNQYFHTLDDTDAEMVMVIHTESGIGYCCNTGTIDVYVNNPTVGQPWCEARDRMCSYLSAEDVLVTSFKQRPVIVFKEETNENLDGFPFDVSTNERGVFYLNTDDGKLPDHHPANVEDIFIITSEGNATITDMVNRQGRVVELIEEWFSEHPNGRLIIIITTQESSNPSWAQDLQNMFMIDNKPEDTPLYVMIVDWSQHAFGATLDNAEEVAKTIALMLNSLMLSEVTTIIAFGSSCHVAGYVGRITMSQYNTEIYEIIALSPQDSAVTPTDAKIVMVIHTYSSPESKNCCNMGTIDIVINSPESGQPWCQGDVQCSIESSIKIFIDAFLYRPILVEKEETGENLNGFPLNVYETETGVFHIETARNGTVIIYNKGDEEDEQEEVEVIPISSWTSNSTIELTDKTDFIEWLEKYPEGQVFIIIKSEENGPKWVSDLREIIEEANQDGYPAFIIIIDWSEYWRDQPGLLNYFANKVAENVIAMITRFEIPVERLTIIAFGTSAHVAGAIGHRFNQENNRLLFKIIALNPTARFYIKGNQYFHTLDDTDAEMVMVIHTESGIGYCCNTGTIDVYVNNPTSGQPWCDARDRICSFLSAEDILVTSFKHRPVVVFNEETNQNLDGFPFDVSTDERGVFYLNTDDGKLPEHHPANVEDLFIITSEGNATITDMMNRQSRVVESIEEWFSEHPNGRLIIIITAQESSNPSWAQDLQNMFMIDNKPEDTPLYVMIVDWSHHPFGATLDNAEEVAKTIALMLNSLMLSEVTTIIAFGSSCHVAGYVGRITMSQYNTEIYEIIALSPQASAVTPTDAKIVMVIHTYSSSESKTCCNMGTIDIVINSPESGQPWCQGDVQCSIESSIEIFIDAFLYRPILVEKEETGENLNGFPLNVYERETGVFHIETARNGTVIIYNKGDEEDEQEEVEVIPISSWTSNSTIELTDKTDFIEWLEKYPEGQVFIIMKSEENGPKWVSDLREIIEEANQDGYPAYIIIIDWSEYWRDEPGLLNYFANKVAENVIAMITRFEIPVERLTIIAFGTSAHVAGAIGHRFNQENNRLLFKIIALNPTARFYIKGNQYFHTLDDTDAEMVMVIHTESGIGYCCNTGTIDVYVNNPTFGQPWCDARDRMCSFLSAEDILVTSFKHRPVVVFNEETNENLDGFPFDVSTDERGVFYLNTDDGKLPEHHPANVEDLFIITSEGNATITDMMNRQNRVVEVIEEWFSDHPNGRLIIIITAQESSNPSWAQDLQNMFMIDNKPEDTPQYVMIVDWSQYSFGATLDNAEEVAKTIALMLNSLMLSEVTTIIAFGPSCHVAGYIGRITISQYKSEIYEIIALSPEASAVTPTDAKIVMVIHTYSSPESKTCCNMGTIDIAINSPESGQPWCQGDVQCSIESSMKIFKDAYLYRPILVKKGETGENLHGFPLNVDERETGVFYIETAQNGTVIIFNKGEEENEQEEVEVIPISSWTSNSTIDFTDKTGFIEWLEKYPEGQVFIIMKSEENGPKWVSDLREIIEEANQDGYPAFIIIIDWSEYWRDEPGLLNYFANKVAENIIAMITRFEIPVEKLTIIAFGTSAHVAGAVGHRYNQENNRLLFKIIALNPTAQFYIEGNQYFHTLDDTDAEMVLVIHTESGIGYCCNTGTIDVYVNNPTVGQPWCDTRDRMCSYLSAEDIFVTSFKQRPVVVFKEETNENLDGFPFDVSTNERGAYRLNIENRRMPIYHPANVEDVLITISEGNISVTDIVNREGQVVEIIEEWFIDHPNGRLIIIITAQESSNPSWAQDLQNMFMIDNKPEDTPLYVMIVDWSQHAFGATLNNAEEVAKTIALMLKSLMLSEVTTIIAFGPSCHVAGYVGRITMSQYNTEIYEIIALSPEASAVTPTDAKIVMVIHTYSSPESKTCCNMGTIDIVINSPESGQPWCQGDVQCSIESSIRIFMDAYLYRPILVGKEETGENLHGFPLNVDETETGVFYIETARNGTVIIFNKGEEDDEQEEVEVIPISSWTSNSTIDLTDKTEFIEWLEKYPEGQVFIIMKSEENGPKWVSDLGEIIEEANQDGYPAFIIIVDWSAYWRHEPGLLNYFANKVTENIMAMITRFEIPVEKLTIIAFGTSAHVAGAVGYRFNQDNNRLLFKIIALNPTAQFYIKGNQYFHTLDDTDAEIVMVIHTESGIGYCCNTGTIDIYVNNPTVGQPWCDSRDRMCSYLSAEDVLVTSFKQRPVVVIKEETNENLDGFPFDVATNKRGAYRLNIENRRMPTHHPANVEDVIITISEGNSTITDIVNREGQVVEIIEEWFSDHPNGRLIIIITVQETSNPSWAQDLQNMFMIDNKPEDTPLYVMIVDWSQHLFGTTLDNAEEVAKTIALMLKNLMLSEVTTIIAFGPSCHVAGYVGRITMSQYNTEIYEIIALSPGASAVTPTDAKIVMVIHTYSSPETKTCCNMGTIDIVINSPESGQPWCQGDVQCSIESSIRIFMDAYLYRPILIVKEETGENLHGFPLNVDETETGVFYIETARNGTVIIFNKGEDDEQEEVEVIPISSWTSNSTIDLTDKTELIEWLEKYPEGQVFIIMKSEENGPKWVSDLGEIIEEANQDGYPAYIIVIDWSAYWRDEPGLLNYFANKVAENIIAMITRFDIPVEKLTIIAFGTSAHVAGAVGHRYKQENNRLLFKIIALNPTAQFYIKGNTYFHTLDDTDAEMVMVIHTESGIGYCCNTGTIDVYVNNPTVGQPWCDARDRMCSYLSAEDILVTSFKHRPVVVIKEETNENLDGFPFDVSTNEKGTYRLNIEHRRMPIHHPANVEDVVITIAEGNATITDIVNREGQVVELVEQWFSDHPNGRLIMIITAQESSNPSWVPDLQNMFMTDNKPEDTPLYVMIVDWSQHPFGTTLDNAEEVAKTIALMLKSLMLSEVTTIIAFGPSCHVAGYVGRITTSQYNTEIYEIIALSPQASAVTPTDAKIVMVIHTYSSPETKTCCNMGTIDIVINSPEAGQPWCQGDVQCSIESSISIFMDAYLYRPILVVKEETGENLHGFPLNVDQTETGVFYIETARNGTVIIFNKGEEEDEQEEVEVIPISSWTSNSSIDLTDKTEFIEWLAKYPEGQVFIIMKSKENGPKWVSDLGEIIEEANPDGYPAFLIVIDWSAYWRDEPGLLNYFANKVAENIIAMITRFEIPVEKLTIMAFGTSAHVAGAVGHRFNQENNRLLFKIIALNPTAQFYIKGNQYFHTLDDTDAEMVMVIHTESGIGYCCNTGTIDVYVNNPTVGQPWCDARDRMCSYLSAEDVLVTSFKQRPVVVFKEETNENLDGFPFDVSTNERGTYRLNIKNRQMPIHQPTNVEDLFVTTSEVNTTVTNILNRRGRAVELIEEWFSDHPNGRLIIIITAQESSNPSWTQDIKDMLMNDNESEDAPLYVMIVDWSQYGASISYGEEVAKLIALMLKSLMLSEVTTIIAFGPSCHVAGYVGRITMSQYETELYEIIALSPQVAAVTPSDAKIVMVIHTNSLPETPTCCNMGTIDIVVNVPEMGQPWCQGDDQCSTEASIRILIDAYLFRPILVKKEETGENLIGFPLNVDATEAGVFHIETTKNGTLTIYTESPENWPPENYSRKKWGRMTVNQTNGAKIDSMIFSGRGTNGMSVPIRFDEVNQELSELIANEPMAEVFIIITEHPAQEWALELQEELLRYSDGPKFVMVIDWSKYVFDSYVFTAANALEVAKKVRQFININNIPPHQIDIIGFSTSAHIAGLVGKSVNSIGRITALDPEYRLWVRSPLRLSETDGTIVQVIHTNTKFHGILEPLGRFDIYVNGGAEQPQCIGNGNQNVDDCSHLMAIKYYIESISRRSFAFEAELQGKVAVKTGKVTIPVGYQLMSIANMPTRVFLLETQDSEPYLPIIRPPVYPPFVDPDRPDSPDWPTIENIQIHINNLPSQMQYMSGGVIKTIRADMQGRKMHLWTTLWQELIPDDNTGLYMIVDGENSDDSDSWTQKLAAKMLHKLGGKIVILTLNWNAYKQNSYIKSAYSAKSVGEYTAEYLHNIQTPFRKLHIIGFSIGAHIAGIIGKRVQTIAGASIARISALDPAGPMFENPELADEFRLSRNDAAFIDVYHTNILAYGFTDPIGTVDFYVNKGRMQPGCDDDACSHRRAVSLYINSLDIEAQAIKVKYEGRGNMAFITESSFTDFGFFYRTGEPGVYYILTNDAEPYIKDGRSLQIEVAEIELPTESFTQIETIDIPGESSSFEIVFDEQID